MATGFDLSLEPRIGSEKCDVIGCEEISTRIVGDGEGHPSCDRHARGSDSVWPPLQEAPKKPMGKAEWIDTNTLLTRRQKRGLHKDLREHGERSASRGRFPRSVIT